MPTLNVKPIEGEWVMGTAPSSLAQFDDTESPLSYICSRGQPWPWRVKMSGFQASMFRPMG
jgi:hypothetical protein